MRAARRTLMVPIVMLIPDSRASEVNDGLGFLQGEYLSECARVCEEPAIMFHYIKHCAGFRG